MGLPQLTHKLDALNILFHCNIREYHISNSYNIIQKPIGLAMDVKLCGYYRIIRSGAFNCIVVYIALWLSHNVHQSFGICEE